MNLILNFSHKAHKVPKVDILYVAPADFRSRDGTLDLVGEAGAGGGMVKRGGGNHSFKILKYFPCVWKKHRVV